MKFQHVSLVQECLPEMGRMVEMWYAKDARISRSKLWEFAIQGVVNAKLTWNLEGEFVRYAALHVHRHMMQRVTKLQNKLNESIQKAAA